MPVDAETRSTAPKAVVLLSGGMDSATLLALVQKRGFQCYALSMDYGQRNRVELETARWQARDAVEHRIVCLDLAQFGGSSLTDSQCSVPEKLTEGIPNTYVPARNTVFLSFALAWAEVLPAGDIFIGANAVDYSGYPDCRPAYIEAFEQMARLATTQDQPMNINAPLIHMSKSEIIRSGLQLGVDYAHTVSCYQPDPQRRACGLCPACRLRLAGFAEINRPDPAPYV